jgi:hypothetical protein
LEQPAQGNYEDEKPEYDGEPILAEVGGFGRAVWMNVSESGVGHDGPIAGFAGAPAFLFDRMSDLATGGAIVNAANKNKRVLFECRRRRRMISPPGECDGKECFVPIRDLPG